jgi:hydrogenase nickel incorporation protein HypA/HybF
MVPSSHDRVRVHELALMESVVDAVIEQIGEERVAIVRLEIGELSGVAVDAMRFSFDVCVRGTSLDGASLDIVSIPGRARCGQCELEYPLTSFTLPCPCGSFERELVAGDELRLTEVEVY